MDSEKIRQAPQPFQINSEPRIRDVFGTLQIRGAAQIRWGENHQEISAANPATRLRPNAAKTDAQPLQDIEIDKPRLKKGLPALKLKIFGRTLVEITHMPVTQCCFCPSHLLGSPLKAWISFRYALVPIGSPLRHSGQKGRVGHHVWAFGPTLLTLFPDMPVEQFWKHSPPASPLPFLNPPMGCGPLAAGASSPHCDNDKRPSSRVFPTSRRS